MPSLKDEFIEWAMDAARTHDQRSGVVALCDNLLHKLGSSTSSERSKRQGWQRYYYAAFDPWPQRAVVERLAANLEECLELSLGHGEWGQIPVRDLSFLRFTPHVESLDIAGMELENLEGVGYLSELLYLHIESTCVLDLGPLAACRKLKEIYVESPLPWVDARVLGTLPSLKKLTWQGPTLGLDSCPCLPVLHSLYVETGGELEEPGYCLRDLHQLPEMPEVRMLRAGKLLRLEGVERFPQLLSLVATGYFQDLAPLIRAPRLTHLRVASHHLRDVAAAARMERLFHLTVFSERPQDYTPLMEAPALRELDVAGCPVEQQDAAMVRAMLPSTDEWFAAPEPRALGPLSLRLIKPLRRREKLQEPEPDSDSDSECIGMRTAWEGCELMQHSEEMWMARRMQAALDEAGLGGPDGVRVRSLLDEPEFKDFFGPWDCLPSRMLWLKVEKPEFGARLAEIVQVIRQVLAGTRWPWKCVINNCQGMSRRLREMMDREIAPPVEASHEWLLGIINDLREARYIRLLRTTYLADKHRLKLLREQGAAPADFVPTPMPKPPVRIKDLAKLDEEEQDEEEQDEEEQEAEEQEEEEERADLVDLVDLVDASDEDDILKKSQLLEAFTRQNEIDGSYMLTLTEATAWAYKSDVKTCEYLLDMKVQK